MDPPDSPPRWIEANERPDWLAEIVDRLEENPDESRPAFEALAGLDDETRTSVAEALSPFADREGVRLLLALLEGGLRATPAIRSAEASRAVDRLDPRIRRSLVTEVDGEGRATIVIATVDDLGRQQTAAFLCDVRRGLLDAIGESDESDPVDVGLFEEWESRADGRAVIDVPELAARLLVGCARLCSPEIPKPARNWLEATLGSSGFSTNPGATLPGPDLDPVANDRIAESAERILDACPDWLDRSPLTRELALEIALREGSPAPDPARDAGAYRYLFEHVFLDRLDLYARMLLWMGWLWRASGRDELAEAAFTMAGQLSDHQYAVPSHPFTVAITTRSLRAAQPSARLSRS